MRYYSCLNQAGPRIPQQPEGMMVNTLKRKNAEKMYNNDTSEDAIPMKKAKRLRSAFTTEQIQYLDTEFRKYPYIGSARRKEVSSALNIPERAVKVWFQNRRMKEKKDFTTNSTECDEHKHSRKTDAANDQLNNECTVTSTNNRHYASLPLISPKNETPKHVDIAVKKENQSFPTNDNKQTPKENAYHKSPSVFQTELHRKYNIYFGNEEASRHMPLLENDVASNLPSSLGTSPKNEVSSTSLYEKLPHDLSRKRNPQYKPMIVQNSPEYFPLNLKKYYTEPPVPVGSKMIWKPFQMMPIVQGASAPAQVAKKECYCECRCPSSSPAPVLLPSAQNPMAQYVLTALPVPNLYYKY